MSLKAEIQYLKESSVKDLQIAKRENELLLKEIARHSEVEKEEMKSQIEKLREHVDAANKSESAQERAKFAELQAKFIDEIRSLTEAQNNLKDESEKQIRTLQKEKEALKCKIEILESSIHEESRISINKISGLKMKQLSTAKQLEEREKECEDLKNEKKNMKLKAQSQRRITKVMQEKIDKNNKTICEQQEEIDKLSKQIDKLQKTSRRNNNLSIL